MLPVFPGWLLCVHAQMAGQCKRRESGHDGWGKGMRVGGGAAKGPRPDPLGFRPFRPGWGGGGGGWGGKYFE